MSDKMKKNGIGLVFALQGVTYAFKHERNMKIHLASALAAVLMGMLFKLDTFEWILLVFVIAFVMVTEMINTCIELIMDHIRPEYHVVTRHIKDVAAGAVLLAAFTAVITGLILFLPKLIEYSGF